MNDLVFSFSNLGVGSCSHNDVDELTSKLRRLRVKPTSKHHLRQNELNRFLKLMEKIGKVCSKIHPNNESYEIRSISNPQLIIQMDPSREIYIKLRTLMRKFKEMDPRNPSRSKNSRLLRFRDVDCPDYRTLKMIETVINHRRSSYQEKLVSIALIYFEFMYSGVVDSYIPEDEAKDESKGVVEWYDEFWTNPYHESTEEDEECD